MEKFFVKSKHDEFEPFALECESISRAANLAVRRINGMSKILAERTTGSANKSGWFQGFVPLGNNQYSSRGPQFHVC